MLLPITIGLDLGGMSSHLSFGDYICDIAQFLDAYKRQIVSDERQGLSLYL